MQAQYLNTPPAPLQAPKQLLTVQQMANVIPAYQGRTGSIRWQIFNSESNGLKESGSIIRHGRRILIDMER
jgi:hypothetical protein